MKNQMMGRPAPPEEKAEYVARWEAMAPEEKAAKSARLRARLAHPDAGLNAEERRKKYGELAWRRGKASAKREKRGEQAQVIAFPPMARPTKT